MRSLERAAGYIDEAGAEAARHARQLDDPDGPDFGGFNQILYVDVHRLAADPRGPDAPELNLCKLIADACELEAMMLLDLEERER